MWADLLERPHIAGRPRSRRRARGAPTRRGRSRPASTGAVLGRGPGAVRRRCRGGHRPADRRGHRPGAAHRHRWPPRRSSAPAPDQPALAQARYERPVRRELVADHRMSVALGRVLRQRARRPRRGPGRRAQRRGPGATSPAGCSRTSRGPSLLTPAPLAPAASCRAGPTSQPSAREPVPSGHLSHGRNRPVAYVCRCTVASVHGEAAARQLRRCGGRQAATGGWRPAAVARMRHAHPPHRPARHRAPGDARRHGRRVATTAWSPPCREAGGIGTLGASTMAPDELPEEMAARPRS